MEEHQEDNLILHGYYQNKYHQSKQNKFVKFIYNNSYDVSQVRFAFGAASFSTLVSTVVLGLINPLLVPLMAYDYYLLCGFASQVLNRTVTGMTLLPNKYQVHVSRKNYLGYEVDRQE